MTYNRRERTVLSCHAEGYTLCVVSNFWYKTMKKKLGENMEESERRDVA